MPSGLCKRKKILPPGNRNTILKTSLRHLVTIPTEPSRLQCHIMYIFFLRVIFVYEIVLSGRDVS